MFSWEFFLSFPYLHTNLWCVLLFVSLVAGWVTHDFWRDDWCLLPITCQFLQPSGAYSSCGFCCLYLKTQQYFAIVGQQMWKYSLRNFRINSEHYGFANFVYFPCMFYCFPVKSSCQLEVASLHVVKSVCVYCLVSWCLSICVWWLAWASSGAHMLVLMLISSSTIKLFSKS